MATCQRGVILPVSVRKCVLGDAIDDPAAATASEDHRVGALVRLNPIDVVETAVILGIVAQPVDEKICRAAVAAQNDLVSVAFALAGVRGLVALGVSGVR